MMWLHSRKRSYVKLKSKLFLLPTRWLVNRLGNITLLDRFNSNHRDNLSLLWLSSN